MTETIAEHAQFVSLLISGMLTLIVSLVVLLGRIVYSHTREEQARQNERLSDLELGLGRLNGEHGKSGRDITHLGSLLKQFVNELKEERRMRELYEKENKADHGEIKADLKGLLRRQVTAS